MNTRNYSENLAQIIHGRRLSECNLQERRAISEIAKYDIPPDYNAQRTSLEFLSKYFPTLNTYKRGKQVPEIQAFIPAMVATKYRELYECNIRATKRVFKKDIIVYLSINFFGERNVAWRQEDLESFFKAHIMIAPKTDIIFTWVADKKLIQVIQNRHLFLQCFPSLLFRQPLREYAFAEVRHIDRLFSLGYAEVENWSFLSSVIFSYRLIGRLYSQIKGVRLPKKSLSELAGIWGISKPTIDRRQHDINIMHEKFREDLAKQPRETLAKYRFCFAES